MKDLGVLVPVVTPCTPSGQPDLPGARAVCDWMLASGCSSIFVMGSTGRGPWFSRSDRATLCRAVADHLGPKVPLFAGCMDTGLSDMMEHARAAADSGAHVAVITAPWYFKYEDHEIESILLKFADASPLPVLIYDIPDFTRAGYEHETLLQLLRHDNVAGLKDSSSDFDRFRRLLSELRAEKDLYLLQGKEHLLAKSLLWRASGIVSTFVHFDPRPFVEIYRAARSGNSPLAQLLQREITRLYRLVIDAYAERPGTSTLFHMVNLALQHRGICDNILLEHEGECPSWLAEKTQEAMRLCERANAIADTARPRA